MKKILSILVAGLLIIPAMAQKTTVVVANSEAGPGVDSRWTSFLKENIIDGMSSLARLQVVNGSNIQGLSNNAAEAVNQLNQAGVNCYVTSRIDSFTNSYKTKNGKTTYDSKLEYSVVVVNVKDGSTITTFKNTGYGSSSKNYDEAYADAFTLVSSDLKKLANRTFLIRGEVKALQDIHPKKGVQTLYVNVGSEVGVEAKVIFEVFKEVDIAGETIREKIGELKVKEVKSATLSLCTVTKNNKKIQEAYEEGLKLYVQSRPSKWENPLPF